MKREFVKAEVKVIKFELSDVIMTSPGTRPDNCPDYYNYNNTIGAWTNPYHYNQIFDTKYYYSNGEYRKSSNWMFTGLDKKVDTNDSGLQNAIASCN